MIELYNYIVGSRRTQITLTDRQHALLIAESIRSGLPMAELIRRAVDAVYRPVSRPGFRSWEVPVSVSGFASKSCSGCLERDVPQPLEVERAAEAHQSCAAARVQAERAQLCRGIHAQRLARRRLAQVAGAARARRAHDCALELPRLTG